MKIIKKSFVIVALLFLTMTTVNVAQSNTKVEIDQSLIEAKARAEMEAEKKDNTKLEDKNIVIMSLKHGQVFIKLRPDLAPKHVARIKDLIEEEFYDGLLFHRVIDGFMAQTGDPMGTGRGGSGVNIKAEFSKEPFIRGVVGMARAQHPDSADSQFFITFDDSRFLDGKYTVVGQVIEGMEFVDRITRGEPPADPDKIMWMRVVSAKQASMEFDLEVPDFIDGDLKPEELEKMLKMRGK